MFHQSRIKDANHASTPKRRNYRSPGSTGRTPFTSFHAEYDKDRQASRLSSCVATSQAGAARYTRCTTIARKRSLIAFCQHTLGRPRGRSARRCRPWPVKPLLAEAEQPYSIAVASKNWRGRRSACVRGAHDGFGKSCAATRPDCSWEKLEPNELLKPNSEGSATAPQPNLFPKVRLLSSHERLCTD